MEFTVSPSNRAFEMGTDATQAPREGAAVREARVEEVFAAQTQNIYRSTDRLFAGLMIFQWLAAILIAILVSPLAWRGQESEIHPHVWTALFYGAVLTAMPVYMTVKFAGQTLTRYTVAIAQMLMSVLLIHLTGGRLETHFHIFGSLAFLAFYRDWKVLVPATLVILADHLLRGIYLPFSVFGVADANLARVGEHAVWVLFEDAFLVVSCLRSQREMHVIAERTAQLEETNARVEGVIIERTAQAQDSEARFRAFMDNNPAVAFMKDADCRLLYVNDKFEKTFALSPAMWQGKDNFELWPPEVAQGLQTHDLAVLRTGQPLEQEEMVPSPDGPRFFLTYKFLIEGADGRRSLGGMSLDITELKRTGHELHEVNDLMEGQLAELRRRAREMELVGGMGELLQSCRTVKEADAIIGKYLGQIFIGDSGSLCILRSSQDRVEVLLSWGDHLTTDVNFAPDDCWSLRRGQLHGVENSSTGIVCDHVHLEGEAGCLCVPLVAQKQILGVLHISNAIGTTLSDSKQRLARTVADQISLALCNLQLQETLRSQNIRDPLTNLFNRRYLEESLEREVLRAQRDGSSLTILMLDIDHFKRFNDTFGHDAGDAVLQRVAQLLQVQMRRSDIICRLGGEEFLTVMPVCNEENALAKAEQLRQQIEALVLVHNGQTLGTITASLGIAVFPIHGTTGEQLVKAADVALYLAKGNGRNQVSAGQSNAQLVAELFD